MTIIDRKEVTLGPFFNMIFAHCRSIKIEYNTDPIFIVIPLYALMRICSIWRYYSMRFACILGSLKLSQWIDRNCLWIFLEQSNLTRSLTLISSKNILWILSVRLQGGHQDTRLSLRAPFGTTANTDILISFDIFRITSYSCFSFGREILGCLGICVARLLRYQRQRIRLWNCLRWLNSCFAEFVRYQIRRLLLCVRGGSWTVCNFRIEAVPWFQRRKFYCWRVVGLSLFFILHLF